MIKELSGLGIQGCLCDTLVRNISITLLHAESNLGSCNVVLTFESIDEIVKCDHSNESY